MWKLTYGLTIVKEGEEDPIEVKDDNEEDDHDHSIEGGTKIHIDDKIIAKLE